VNAALTMCNIPLSKPPKKITKGGRLCGSVTTLNGVWSQQLGSQESSPVGPTDVSGVNGLWVSCCPVVARGTCVQPFAPPIFFANFLMSLRCVELT
jgi:hypothetical protein